MDKKIIDAVNYGADSNKLEDNSLTEIEKKIILNDMQKSNESFLYGIVQMEKHVKSDDDCKENNLSNYKPKYEHNDILINKLNINDSSELDRVERMITTRKLAKLYLNPGKQTFDVNHYLSIHKYLFEDIYDFAGEIRSENIMKPIPFHEGEHLSFCLPQFIYSELKRVLDESKMKINNINSKEELIIHIGTLYSDLDIIHPFREGNGRTLREFIRQYMEYICKINKMDNYYLDYSEVDRNTYLNAIIKADTVLYYDELIGLFDSILKVSNTNINDKSI